MRHGRFSVCSHCQPDRIALIVRTQKRDLLHPAIQQVSKKKEIQFLLIVQTRRINSRTWGSSLSFLR